MSDSPGLKITALLGRALERLKKQNPVASIRGLALQMSVTPSYLSKVFRGERAFPAKKIGEFAQALRLDHHEVAEIHRLLLLDHEIETLATKTGLRTLQKPRRSLSDYETLGKTLIG